MSHNSENITPTAGSIRGKYRRLPGVHSGMRQEGTGIIVMNVIVMISEFNMRAK